MNHSKGWRSAPARAWHRWKEPWAWTAAGAAFGWFIAAHLGYLAHVALTAGNPERGFPYLAGALIIAVTCPVALHFRPGRHLQVETGGVQEESAMTMMEEFQRANEQSVRVLLARYAGALGSEANRMAEDAGTVDHEGVRGAAKDLADYLGLGRPVPPENRVGIPHAQEWDAGHALHMIKDLAIALDEARDETGPERYAALVRQLLDLTITTAECSRQGGTEEFLDQLVRGQTPAAADPRGAAG